MGLETGPAGFMGSPQAMRSFSRRRIARGVRRDSRDSPDSPGRGKLHVPGQGDASARSTRRRLQSYGGDSRPYHPDAIDTRLVLRICVDRAHGLRVADGRC